MPSGHHGEIKVGSVDAAADTITYAIRGQSENLQKYREAIL